MRIIRGVLIILFVMLASMTVVAAPVDSSFKHTWVFQATSMTPSASLDGTLEVRIDSDTFVAGVITLGKKKLPFRGRHLGPRLALRTDEGFSPVLRLDANADSAFHSMTGVLTSSKVHATDARHHSQDFTNVLFDLYAVRK